MVEAISIEQVKSSFACFKKQEKSWLFDFLSPQKTSLLMRLEAGFWFYFYQKAIFQTILSLGIDNLWIILSKTWLVRHVE